MKTKLNQRKSQKTIKTASKHSSPRFPAASDEAILETVHEFLDLPKTLREHPLCPKCQELLELIDSKFNLRKMEQKPSFFSILECLFNQI